MRDRDSKREADRERRARIKAGTWNFPNGGAAEFAKAGAAIHTSSKRLGHSQNRRIVRRNLRFSRPRPRRAPAPRSLRAPCHSANVRPRCLASAGSRLLRPARRHRRQWSRLVECPVVALFPKATVIPAPPDIAAVSSFTKWHEKTETMLATLAANADIQDRRIAVLEASHANRSACALDVARALAGTFQLRRLRPRRCATSSVAEGTHEGGQAVGFTCRNVWTTASAIRSKTGRSRRRLGQGLSSVCRARD